MGPAALLFAAGALAASLAWLLEWPGVGLAGRFVLIAGLALWAWRRGTLTSWILVSMVVGAEIGYDFPEIAVTMRLLSQVFIRMIKTIIAPAAVRDAGGGHCRPPRPASRWAAWASRRSSTSRS